MQSVKPKVNFRSNQNHIAKQFCLVQYSGAAKLHDNFSHSNIFRKPLLNVQSKVEILDEKKTRTKSVRFNSVLNKHQHLEHDKII